MKRFFITIILYLIFGSIQSEARIEPGIHFLHQTPWTEVVAKAKAEKKLIFMDFYTQWCGPCMNMAETVFVLPEVGAFYNEHFVCLKVDAEHGEGVGLAKKYGVRVYPTYMFVDPDTGEAVHRSSSTQTAEIFIRTGEGALDPELRSFYLEKEYEIGNRSKKFLLDYLFYEHSIYQRDKVTVAFAELLQGGATLSDSDIWDAFVSFIPGMTPYLKQVSSEYETYCRLFSQNKVDEKLAKETTYGNYDEIASLCDFEGKKFNLKIISLNNILRQQQYEKGAMMIDSLIADSLVNQQKLMGQLTFIVRQVLYNKDVPLFWFDKCVEYARYVAYNWDDRRDANVHQMYATLLEEGIKRYSDKKTNLERKISEPPSFGAKIYSMRPTALKPKPMRKK